MANKNTTQKSSIESEKKLEKKLVSEVKRIGGWCIKMLTNHITGLPDRLCLFPDGIVVFVEVKTAGEKPKRIQTLVHSRLTRMGFEVLVIDSSDQIKEFIRRHENDS